MLSDKFTILELLDLALRVPEIGAVNFNILHTALTNMVIELGLDHLRPLCHIQDEVIAQAAVTKGRLEDPLIRGRKRPERDLQDIRTRLHAADLKRIGVKEVPTPIVEDITKKVIKESKESVQEEQLESSKAGQDETSKAGQDESSKSGQAELLQEEPKESSLVGQDESSKVEQDESSKAGQDESSKAGQDEPSKAGQAELLQVEKKDSSHAGQDEPLQSRQEESAQAGKEDEDTEKDKPIASETDLRERSEEPKRKSELTVSIPDLTKDLRQVSDEEMVAQVRAVAADILEKSTDRGAGVKELLEDDMDAEKLATRALKALTDEDIFITDPSKVVQEMWRAINVNRRMDGAEEGLREFSLIVDMMLDKLQQLEESTSSNQSVFHNMQDYFDRIEKLESKCEDLETGIEDANEFTRNEIARLEDIIDGLRKELALYQKAFEELEAMFKSLCDRVAYKEDIEDLRNLFRSLEEELNKLRELTLEIQDSMVRKEDFAELLNKVGLLEENTVSRDELGSLLEPDFLENLIEEQGRLRSELDELKLAVADLDERLNDLIRRIDEEILPSIQATFDEIQAAIDEMKAKLDTLDADDINDTFARLEEQIEMIIKDLDGLRADLERFEKEARANFRKLADYGILIERLEAVKADKSKMYELLELKADLELVLGKLDRSEFAVVMKDLEETIERLTITVKINEEEMNLNFTSIRKELSFKMYTEDFIIGTEPIRNRIKAMIYEQEKIKEIALQNFFPDAPGVVKCFSCKRAANLASLKYPASYESMKSVGSKTESNSKRTKEPAKSSEESSEIKLPPIDIDEIPIPPADKPRIQDIHQLPVLFANARPQVGLVHEKRKKDIDKDVAAYFSTGKLYAVGGEHTKTFPQQRGLAFTTMTLPEGKKSDVLLQGLDKRYYKGTTYKTSSSDVSARTPNHQGRNEPDTKPMENKNNVLPSVVTLQNVSAKARPDISLSVPINAPKQVRSQTKIAASKQTRSRETIKKSFGLNHQD